MKCGHYEEVGAKWFENLDITTIVTLINTEVLEEKLLISGYDKEKTEHLVQGFRNGFDIGYRGPEDRKHTSANIPLRLGTKVDLWNKLMKEVEHKRVAGPFKEIPFETYMQSPIGLVPKADNQLRMIFHLSYDFGTEEEAQSLNYHTLKELCSVHYHDLDYAIEASLKLERDSPWPVATIFYSKTDLKSAFRILPLLIRQIRWLIMKAEDPITKEICYFVDKCLPFRASRSCALFQAFSDGLKHLVEYAIARIFAVTNYLDDFLFVGYTIIMCNNAMNKFLEICHRINYPVAAEKTEFASPTMIFLGALLDRQRRCLAIPQDKVIKAKNQLHLIVSKRKAQVKELQSLTGLLNFLNRALVPGRAFTRRMYLKIPAAAIAGLNTNKFRTNGSPDVGKKRFELKPYYHVKLDLEFKEDCSMWLSFLEHSNDIRLCRPVIDLNIEATSQELFFYTDASKAVDKGFGCFFYGSWTFAQWENDYIRDLNPSIEYLELYALLVGVFTWCDHLCDKRIIIFCDNQAIVHMVNNTLAKCKNCMRLIQMLVMNNLQYNRRIYVKYVRSRDNYLSDSLSRLDFQRFWEKAPHYTDKEPTMIPDDLWPASKLWLY